MIYDLKIREVGKELGLSKELVNSVRVYFVKSRDVASLSSILPRTIIAGLIYHFGKKYKEGVLQSDIVNAVGGTESSIRNGLRKIYASDLGLSSKVTGLKKKQVNKVKVPRVKMVDTFPKRLKDIKALEERKNKGLKKDEVKPDDFFPKKKSEDGDLWHTMNPGEDFVDWLERMDKEEKDEFSKSIKARQKFLFSHKKSFIKDYLSNHTWKYLQNKYHFDKDTLNKYLREWGVPKRLAKKTNVFMNNKDRMIELYEEGVSTREIAEMFRLKEVSVYQRLKNWGVKMRSKRPYDVNKALDLLKKGEDPIVVGRLMGVSSASMYKLRAKQLGEVSNKKAFFGMSSVKFIKLLYHRGFSIPEIFTFLKRKGLLMGVESDQPLRDFINSSKKKSAFGPRQVVFNRKDKFDVGARLVSLKKYDLSFDEVAMFKSLVKAGLSYEDVAYRMFVSRLLLNDYFKRKFDSFKKVAKSVGNKDASRLTGFVLYNVYDDLPNKLEFRRIFKDLRSRGFSTFAITFLTGASENVINKAIEKSSDVVRVKIHRHDYDKFLPVVKKMRLEKKTVNEIAAHLGVSLSVVGKIIRDYKIPYVKRVFDEGVRRKIAELYKANVHPREIALRLGVKQKSLELEIHRMGLVKLNKPWNIKNHKYSDQETALQNNIIRKFYSEPHFKSIHALSKKLGLDKTTVKARLKNMGIKIRTKEQADKLRRVSKWSSIKIHPEEESVVLRRKYTLRRADVKSTFKDYSKRLSQ